MFSGSRHETCLNVYVKGENFLLSIIQEWREVVIGGPRLVLFSRHFPSGRPSPTRTVHSLVRVITMGMRQSHKSVRQVIRISSMRQLLSPVQILQKLQNVSCFHGSLNGKHSLWIYYDDFILLLSVRSYDHKFYVPSTVFSSFKHNFLLNMVWHKT